MYFKIGFAVLFSIFAAAQVNGQFQGGFPAFPSFPNQLQGPGVIPQGGVGLPNPNSGPSPQWTLINAGISPFQGPLRPLQFQQTGRK